MYVQIAAIAAAACLYVMGAALLYAARQVRGAEPLRDAAFAEFVVGTGLLIRVWAPDSQYGPILFVATVTYAAHAAWILAALRRLRGWTPRYRAGASALLLVAVAAGAGLVWPSLAYPGLGLAYLLIAGLYFACTAPAFRAADTSMRLPLLLIGGAGTLCVWMYVAWGTVLMVAPDLARAQGSGPALAASFMFGLWLNLVATGGYLLIVLRRLVDEIEANALLDPLTGAHNRRGLERHLERGGRPGSERTLIAIDIDHFKRVNDTHGHAAGDRVLAACAARLRSALRGSDLLVRLGGEEFLVVLEGADARTADAIAERLRRTIAEQPVQLPGGIEIAVTISLGVTAAATSLDAELERADRALYAAKQSGRNRVVRAEALAA